MASVNKVILIGNLGRDPETRYTADGAAITNITIATSDRWKDKASGEMKESTEWHRVAFFGRLAEIDAPEAAQNRRAFEAALRLDHRTDRLCRTTGRERRLDAALLRLRPVRPAVGWSGCHARSRSG